MPRTGSQGGIMQWTGSHVSLMSRTLDELL
jgi:hypothetical protein